MATSTVVPSAVEETASDTPDFGNEPVKSETVDYYRFQLIEPKTEEVKDEQGNVSTSYDYDVKVYANPSENYKKGLLAKGYEIKFIQPVTKQTAGNPDGMPMIISDPVEMVAVFMRGVAQKLQQITSKKFAEDKNNQPGVPAWSPTEEPANFSADLNERTNRRNLSPDERLKKDLRDSGCDEEDIIVMFAARAKRAAEKAAAAAAAKEAAVAQ